VDNDCWKFSLYLNDICVTKNINKEGNIRDFIYIDGLNCFALATCFGEGLSIQDEVSLRSYCVGWAMPDIKFTKEKIWYIKDDPEKYPNDVTRIGFISENTEIYYDSEEMDDLAAALWCFSLHGSLIWEELNGRSP
jgi:hypothetical protein